MRLRIIVIRNEKGERLVEALRISTCRLEYIHCVVIQSLMKNHGLSPTPSLERHKSHEPQSHQIAAATLDVITNISSYNLHAPSGRSAWPLQSRVLLHARLSAKYLSQLLATAQIVLSHPRRRL